jgi:hypothetical protein
MTEEEEEADLRLELDGVKVKPANVPLSTFRSFLYMVLGRTWEDASSVVS